MSYNRLSTSGRAFLVKTHDDLPNFRISVGDAFFQSGTPISIEAGEAVLYTGDPTKTYAGVVLTGNWLENTTITGFKSFKADNLTGQVVATPESAALTVLCKANVALEVGDLVRAVSIETTTGRVKVTNVAASPNTELFGVAMTNAALNGEVEVIWYNPSARV
jgi:hypothetical protein